MQAHHGFSERFENRGAVSAAVLIDSYFPSEAQEGFNSKLSLVSASLLCHRKKLYDYYNRAGDDCK